MGNSPSCDESCQGEIAEKVVQRIGPISRDPITITCPTTEDIRATMSQQFPILNNTVNEVANITANYVNAPTATQIATEISNTITCPTTAEIAQDVVSAMPAPTCPTTTEIVNAINCPTAREISNDVLWARHFNRRINLAGTISTTPFPLGKLVGNQMTSYETVTRRDIPSYENSLYAPTT